MTICWEVSLIVLLLSDIKKKKRKTKMFTSASSSGTGSSLLLCMFWKRCRRGSRGALVPWVERSLSISLVPLSQRRSSSRTADSSWLGRHRDKITAFQLQEDISIGKLEEIVKYLVTWECPSVQPAPAGWPGPGAGPGEECCLWCWHFHVHHLRDKRTICLL